MIRPSQVQLCIRSSIYWVSSTNTIPMKSSPSSRGCLQKAPPGPTRLLDLPRHLETIDPLSSIVVLNFLLNPPTFILCTFLRAWLDQILLYILLVPKRHVLKSTFIVVLFFFIYLCVWLRWVSLDWSPHWGMSGSTLKIYIASEKCMCYHLLYSPSPPVCHKRHFPPV